MKEELPFLLNGIGPVEEPAPKMLRPSAYGRNKVASVTYSLTHSLIPKRAPRCRFSKTKGQDH